jgi:hypothetical protein
MENQKNRRGGARPGAGRPKGVPDKATAVLKAGLEELARGHTETGLIVVVLLAQASESDSARVAAANALLDRGYGKPRQGVEHSGPNGAEIEVNVNLTTSDRARALAAFVAKTKAEK